MEDSDELILVVPVKILDFSFGGKLFLCDSFSSLINDVDVSVLSADCTVRGILTPAENWSFGAVDLLVVTKYLFTRCHYLK